MQSLSQIFHPNVSFNYAWANSFISANCCITNSENHRWITLCTSAFHSVHITKVSGLGVSMILCVYMCKNSPSLTGETMEISFGILGLSSDYYRFLPLDKQLPDWSEKQRLSPNLISQFRSLAWPYESKHLSLLLQAVGNVLGKTLISPSWICTSILKFQAGAHIALPLLPLLLACVATVVHPVWETDEIGCSKYACYV